MAVLVEKGGCRASGVGHVAGKIHVDLLRAAVKMRRARKSPICHGAGLHIAVKDSFGGLVSGGVVLLQGVRVAAWSRGQALHHALEMRACRCGHCTTSGGRWQTWGWSLHKALPPLLKGGVGGDLSGGAVWVACPALSQAHHVLKVGSRAAPAPRMKRRSGEPHLVDRHFEHLAVQRRAQPAGVPVKGGHNHIALHAQGVETVLLSGAGEIGALCHHQAARFGAGHLKLLGDGGDGPVRSLPPYNHLGELGVYAVHKALLVGPATVTESLAVRGPWPGEHLCDGALVDGLHGPAHAQALLDLIGRVVKAPGVGLPGSPVYVVKLVGV